MDQNFSETVFQILGNDARYHADAYDFVNAAVTYTAKKLERDRKPRGSRHVTAEELITGAMDYAVAQFGFLAPSVLKHWGIFRGEDFGNIVYNMIDVKLLSASPEDSRTDFQCHPELADELQQRIDTELLVPDPPPAPRLD